MAVKRIVDTSFWNDDKVVEQFSPEDKLFMLYLLTNPHTTQLGIYQINKKVMAFELGYSLETIGVLLDRFEDKYKMIKYCNETNEIAIKNYLRYSIVKGGKPVEDCLSKDIKQVKNRNLINYVFNNIKEDSNINETVNKIINIYINDNDNYNDNDNDNDVSYHDSYHDSSDDKKIYELFEQNLGRLLSPIEIEKIQEWDKDFEYNVIEYALKKSILSNKKNLNYVGAILRNWKTQGYNTLEEIKDNEQPNLNVIKPKTEKIVTPEEIAISEYNWLDD